MHYWWYASLQELARLNCVFVWDLFFSLTIQTRLIKPSEFFANNECSINREKERPAWKASKLARENGKTSPNGVSILGWNHSTYIRQKCKSREGEKNRNKKKSQLIIRRVGWLGFACIDVCIFGKIDCIPIVIWTLTHTESGHDGRNLFFRIWIPNDDTACHLKNVFFHTVCIITMSISRIARI